MNRRLLSILLATILCGCGSNDKKKEETPELARQEQTEELAEVETMVLREVPFRHQIATNGKLRAANKSVLTFSTSGTIEEISVANGQRVGEGAVLARLDETDARQALKSATQGFEKAQIDLEDAIIGFGHEGLDDPTIREETMHFVKIRSGYNSSELNLENARKGLDACTLRAPFAGRIANVKGNRHERNGGEFCTLIDDSRLVVDFGVLETELPFVQVGNTVKVASYFDPGNSVEGRILSVNPLVDANGQVLVEAGITNNGTFIDGMNVKLLVEKDIPDRLVVPKGAVVMRDNLEVLFRYRDGKALWTYVHTLMENSTEYVVTANTEREADLSVGDTVIVTGNMNLANGTAVRLER